MIKVLLADDQVLLRESIGYILSTDSEIEIVGMVGNGTDAVEKCIALRPDIVLMDIEMPELDGVLAAKNIKEQCPNIKIIILTTFERPDNIMAAFAVNVDGYIVKDINHENLILTVKTVYAGLTVIHDSVKKIMTERFGNLLEYKNNYEEKLSKKEIEIIRRIARGCSNKEIATELNYSEGTIKNNVSKILEKLEMSDRIQIAIFAMENGIA